MAIYRPQRRRWILAAVTGALGLLVGLLVGWGLLRPDPDPAEVLEEVRGTLLQAAATLEVVEVEYTESVEDGAVVASPEFEGARAALASSRERYLEVREAVATVAPRVAAEIDGAYADLERLVADRAPADEVGRLVEDLRDLLMEALGG